MTSYTSHAQLLADLSRAVSRDHAARRRRRRIVLAILAVMGVCAATVAAATQAPWWQTAPPPVNPQVVDRQLAPTIGSDFPPSADRARARTVAEWHGATLVAAPVGDKGYCLIPALPGSPDISLSCEYQATDEVRAYARPGSDPRWIIWGRFVETEAATIDLGAGIGGSLLVTLQPGGFFIADLPPSRWSALDNGASTASLLDASGKKLQSVCLNFGPSPESKAAGKSDTPSPLTSGGQCKAHPLIEMAPQLDKAKKLVETTLRYGAGIMPAGSRVATYEAPDAASSATCLFVAPVPLPTDRQPVGAMTCGGMVNPASKAHPLNAWLASGLSHGSYDHLVGGAVDPSLGAARVEVQLPGEVVPLSFANDHFIGDLPPTDKADVNAAFVVAYDASGREIARQQLGIVRH
jgi:hypothetical protein